MSENDLANKKVLVIGLGLSGRAAVKFLLTKQAQVYAVDQNKELINKHSEIEELIKQGLVALHDKELDHAKGFDLVIVSPGVPKTNKHYASALENQIEIIGEVELGFRNINQPIVAITGTNGKTTTTLLTAHVLNKAGFPAVALGNVGTPLTAEITQRIFSESNIFVVELSSFQLETLKSKVIDVGVILNITPDHLDRYPSFEDYAKAKTCMQDCLKENAKFYVYEQILKDFRHLLSNRSVETYGYETTSSMFTDKESIFFNKNLEYILPEEYRGLESHDVENIMAAYLLCKNFGVTGEQFLAALKTFKKPAHRVEFVRTFKDVIFYDDSKGTNIDAVIRAVRSIKGEILLIAGGVDKGSAYTPWINAFEGKVKNIFAIGQASKKIVDDLGQNLPVEKAETLEDAVKAASKLAKPGQVVLLSPGCSSYDMFRDYVHRGEEFKRIVNALEDIVI
jgi:UDP-N-acetylmuramoylalanine--D-glutamate ligase